MKHFIFSCLLICALPNLANAGSCIETEERVENARLSIMSLSDGRCWLTVRPDFPKGLIYRSFLFDNHGFLMVFNSFGEGPSSTHTGAREFYLLPRLMPLEGRVHENTIQVTVASGVVLHYDAIQLRFVGAEGATVFEEPVIAPGNRGGFELKPDQGLVLDFGFRMGSSPTGERSGKLRVIDRHGKECVLGNKEILKWDADGDPMIRFATDTEAFAYIQSRCPSLKIPF